MKHFCVLFLVLIGSLTDPIICIYHRHHDIKGAIKIKWRNTESTGDTPPIYGSSAVSLDDQVYLLAGSNQTSQFTNNVYHFDAVQDSWQTLSTPTDVELGKIFESAASVCGDRIYLFGGKEDYLTSTSKLSIFNPKTNIWSSRGNYHPSPPPMHGHSFVSIEHKYSHGRKKTHSFAQTQKKFEDIVPVISPGLKQSLQAQDPDMWSSDSFLQLEKGKEQEQEQHVPNPGNCDIFVIGGRIDGWITLLSDSIWAFDTVTRGWRQINKGEKQFPHSRIQHVAVAVKSEIFLFGGDVGVMQKAFSDDCWIYDSFGGDWNICPAIGRKPPALVGATAVNINSVVYIFGGYDGHSVLDSVFAFDMKTYKWVGVQLITPSHFTISPRAFHMAVAIPTKNIISNSESRRTGNEKNSEFLEQWQQIVADDGVKHVMVVTGGSGYYQNTPILGDTWIMEPIIEREEDKEEP